MARKNILPIRQFEILLKELGAERVSYEAAKELCLITEEKVKEVLEEALKIAQHANRTTVFASDIRLARKKLNV